MLKRSRGILTLVCGGGLLLWLGIICWPYFLKYPVPDESTFLYEGLRVVQGDVPYRDFFDFIMPGIFYLIAGIYKLTSGSLAAVRLTALGMTLGNIGLTLYLAHYFLPKRWLVSLGLFLLLVHLPLGLEMQHHLCSAFTGLVAITCLWKGTLASTQVCRKWIIASGIAIGLTVLFTQTLGGFLALSSGSFLLLYFWKKQHLTFLKALQLASVQLALPALAPILIVFAWFAAQGAFQNLWQSTVLWVFRGGYADTTSHWYFLDGFTKLASYLRSHVLFKDLHITLFTILMLSYGALPVLGLLWPAEYFARQWKHNGTAFWSNLQPKDWRLLFIWFIGWGFWMAIFSYPNTRMIATHSWLLYILAWMILLGMTKKRQAVQVALGAGLLLFSALYWSFETEKSLSMLHTPRIYSYGTRERELISEGNPAYTKAFNQMVQYIRNNTPTGQNLFIFNQSPEIYLVTRRKNPTRFQLVMALYNTPEQIAEVTRDLEKKKPAMILYNHLDELNFSYDLRFQEARERHFDYHLHALEDLLSKDYQLSGELGSITLFRRRSSIAAMSEADSATNPSGFPPRE